jgi:rhodanese-related sulfurtransferase
MAEPKRIPVKEAYQKLKSGKALLICGYDDDAKFKAMRLEGALSLKEFEDRLPNLSKDQEIIFYCA